MRDWAGHLVVRLPGLHLHVVTHSCTEPDYIHHFGYSVGRSRPTNPSGPSVYFDGFCDHSAEGTPHPGAVGKFSGASTPEVPAMLTGFLRRGSPSSQPTGESPPLGP